MYLIMGVNLNFINYDCTLTFYQHNMSESDYKTEGSLRCSLANRSLHNMLNVKIWSI